MSADKIIIPRVAFQGERGAFSEGAVITLMGGRVELVPCPTFDSLFDAVPHGRANFALAPIENTLAGSVHRSYDLLLERPLHIVAEVVIPISHCLIGLPDSILDRITQVESHPVALAQCERFFARHPEINRIATDDTAGSVAAIMKRGDPRNAAIAGRRAAQVYGAKVLAERLEDHAENYTRFVLLAAQPQSNIDADKLSLVVKLKHRPGALAGALKPFADRGIDLLKIESRPVLGTPWQYHFYLDLKGSIVDPKVAGALEELKAATDDVRILGCYKSAATNKQ